MIKQSIWLALSQLSGENCTKSEIFFMLDTGITFPFEKMRWYVSHNANLGLPDYTFSPYVVRVLAFFKPIVHCVLICSIQQFSSFFPFYHVLLLIVWRLYLFQFDSRFHLLPKKIIIHMHIVCKNILFLIRMTKILRELSNSNCVFTKSCS